MEELLKTIAELELERKELVFTEFNEETAWVIGNRIRSQALKNHYAISVHISLGGRTLFGCSMEGAAPINDDWMRRKENTVYRFYKSSYEMSLYMKLKKDRMGNRYGLDEKDYAAAGGSVPVALKGSGVVGAITVSGLAEDEDHGLVTGVIREYLSGAEEYHI